MAAKLTEKQLKEGWSMVKFGEIARNISERVEPGKTDLQVYVGLEHLDPGSLRITRKGTPDDVAGQKLRVRPGQIIFGKRRAYQKKVAVSDFDGICSAHAMVLEAIPGKIIPELLPFLMQSDMFMDRAVAISEGSLSPTIKWTALARQEFPLPPFPRQKEILKFLHQLENCEIKADGLIACLNRLIKVLKKKIVTGSVFSKHTKITCKNKKLGMLCEINYGKSPSGISDPNGAFKIWGTGGITGRTNQVLCNEHAILIGRKGTIDEPQLIKEPFWAIDTTFYCIPKDGASIEWLFWYLSSIDLKSHNEASGVPSLSRNTLNNINVLLPEPEIQSQHVVIMDYVMKLINATYLKKTQLKKIRSQLLFQIFFVDCKES